MGAGGFWTSTRPIIFSWSKNSKEQLKGRAITYSTVLFHARYALHLLNLQTLSAPFLSLLSLLLSGPTQSKLHRMHRDQSILYTHIYHKQQKLSHCIKMKSFLLLLLVLLQVLEPALVYYFYQPRFRFSGFHDFSVFNCVPFFCKLEIYK